MVGVAMIQNISQSQTPRLRTRCQLQIRQIEIETLLASLNRRFENVWIIAVIIPELKLGNIEWHVFGADFVESANNATLKDTPKSLDGVGVNGTDDILPAMVIDGLARVFSQPVIDAAFVGRQQTNLVADHLAHKPFGFEFGDFGKYASDHVALAAYRANDRGLAADATLDAAFLVLMPIGVFTADVGLIDLDNSSKLGFRFDQPRADFVGHVERGFVRAETHLPLDLQTADALLAGHHQVNDFEPLAKRLVRVLKDRARDMGETVALIRRAFVALPFASHRLDRKYLGIATAGAIHALGPAPGNQVVRAMILIGEHRLKLAFGHLVDWFRSLSHRSIFLSDAPYIAAYAPPVERQIIADYVYALCPGNKIAVAASRLSLNHLAGNTHIINALDHLGLLDAAKREELSTEFLKQRERMDRDRQIRDLKYALDEFPGLALSVEQRELLSELDSE